MFRNRDTTLRNFTTTIFNLDRQIDKLMYDRQIDRQVHIQMDGLMDRQKDRKKGGIDK